MTMETKTLTCTCCGTPIEKSSAYDVSGKYYCEDCYETETFECESCGERFPIEEQKFWGDMRICSECLEDFVPSFDQDENDEETEEAYESLRDTYIGLKTNDLSYGVHELEYIDNDSDPAGIYYFISVTIDEHGTVTDISRLRASIALWESVNSSEWAPYPIDPDDYDDRVESIWEDNDIEFEEGDTADFEDEE